MKRCAETLHHLEGESWWIAISHREYNGCIINYGTLFHRFSMENDHKSYGPHYILVGGQWKEIFKGLEHLTL